jgi:hypothetical protein
VADRGTGCQQLGKPDAVYDRGEHAGLVRRDPVNKRETGRKWGRSHGARASGSARHSPRFPAQDVAAAHDHGQLCSAGAGDLSGNLFE